MIVDQARTSKGGGEFPEAVNTRNGSAASQYFERNDQAYVSKWINRSPSAAPALGSPIVPLAAR